MRRSPWPRVALLLSVLAAPVPSWAQTAPLPSDTHVTPSDSTRLASAATFDAVVDTVDVLAGPVVWICQETADPRVRVSGARADGDMARAMPGGAEDAAGWSGVADGRDSLRRVGPFQRPTTGFEPVRFGVAVGSLAAVDAGLLVALSDLWYTSRGRWHWYSDAPAETGIPDDGWLDDWHTYAQMDKAGHAFTAWHFARGAGRLGRWTGMSNRAAGWFGGAASIAFQSQIELLDGYDPTYGASRTDLLANVVGGVIGGIQVAHPEKTAWFNSRVSYHPSPYYDESTSGIGNSLKDYDGSSYWLVAFPSDLGAPRWWPRWLGASLGYGADGLAHPVSGIGEGGAPNGPEHRREYYLSLDVDLLRTGRVPRVLRPAVWVLSFLRVPMPALQFGPAGTRFHPLYY